MSRKVVTDKKVLASRFSRLVYCLFKTCSAHSHAHKPPVVSVGNRVIVMFHEAGDGFSFSEKPTVWFCQVLEQNNSRIQQTSELRMYNFKEKLKKSINSVKVPLTSKV